MKQPKKLSLFAIALLIASPAFLGGCMSNLSGQSYDRNEVRRVQQVKQGTIIDVQMVAIEGTKSGIGAAAGGAVGGIAGSTVGGGKGSEIVAIVGAVAGGVLGAKAEGAATREQGIQMTIELDNGSYISIVQQHDANVFFQPGQRVKILTSSGVSRVIY